MSMISHSKWSADIDESNKIVDGRFRLVKQIGDGLQSKVYLGQKLKENPEQANSDDKASEMTVDTFAVKIFDKEEFKDLGLTEFSIMNNISEHPNILKVYEHQSNGIISENIFTQSGFEMQQICARKFDYMTMEYCPNGDLFEFVRQTGRLKPQLARYYFHQLLDAVEHLHIQCQVAHLDLKLENILIGNDLKIRLCDFGFCESISTRVKKNKGTDGYKAPEIYLHHKTGYEGEKADFFALGVILFIMEFGVPPFTMATRDNPYYRCFYRGHNYARLFFRLHPTTKIHFQNGELDADLSELLLALLDENPELRPKSIKEIKSFAYLQKDLATDDEAKEQFALFKQKSLV